MTLFCDLMGFDLMGRDTHAQSHLSTHHFCHLRSLLVVGCWLLVVGCWLLVVGCWLLVGEKAECYEKRETQRAFLTVQLTAPADTMLKV